MTPIALLTMVVLYQLSYNGFNCTKCTQLPEKDLFVNTEPLIGIEPMTPTLPWWCSTS
jgi:hypothetical protein